MKALSIALAAGLLLAVLPAAALGDVWISNFTRTTGGDVYEGDTVTLRVDLGYSHGSFVDASGEVVGDRFTTSPWHWPRTEPIPASSQFSGGATTYYASFTYRQDGVANARARLTSGRTRYKWWVWWFYDTDYDGSAKYLNFNVRNAPPTITSLTPDLTVGPGESFGFAATATDRGVLDVLTFDWDLDADGLYDDFSGSGGSTSFAACGLYPMGVQVSDGDGGYAYGSFNVDVVPEPATWLLWGAGVLGLLYCVRRGRKRTK